MNAVAQAIRERRRRLKMPLRWLAKRAGLPISDVAAILRDRATPGASDLDRLAATVGLRAIGDQVEEAKPLEAIRSEAAAEKARFIAKALQGTMLLESQGVDQQTLGGIIADNTDYFLSHPRQLWG